MTPSTAAEEPGRDRLSCGRPVDELFDQVSAERARELDAHQGGCPHCQAALAEYDRLWAPVRDLARTEVRAPESVLEEAIRRIRGAASDPEYGTLPGPKGTTRISARVVVVTARQSAEDIAGVRVALSKLVSAGVTPTTDDDHPADAPSPGGAGPDSAHEWAESGSSRLPRPTGARVVAGVAGQSTAIEVTLAADYGTDLLELGERIRVHVAAQVREITGLDPVTVAVRIDDVFD